MKLAQIGLNLVLVGAGIFVYDAIKSGSPEPTPPAEQRTEAERPREEPAQPAPSAVVLPGAPDRRLVQQVEMLQERLASLEQRVRSRTEVVADAGVEDDGAGGGYSPPAVLDPENPSFDREEIERFEALYETMQRIQREERFTEMISNQLDRIGVDLTDEQRATVVQETRTYREKVREVLRAVPRGEDAPAARQEALQAVREEYSQTLYSFLPASEAEKIVDSMARAPGTIRQARSRFVGRGER